MITTPEALTPEEREIIGSDTSNEDANATELARKLLRIHDRQAAALSALAEIPDAILEAWRTDGSVWQSNVAVEELARRGKRYTRSG